MFCGLNCETSRADTKLGVSLENEENMSGLAIPTCNSRLRLVTLSAEDIDAYYALVDANRDHLTRYGDYSNAKLATRISVSEEIMNASDDRTRMGLWNDDTLIGRIDLHEKEPGKFVLGYWLGSTYTGHGYATMACRAIIAYAREAMVASEISAGVTKGNSPSEALLARLGFRNIADMGSYNRFILCLNDDPRNLFPG